MSSIVELERALLTRIVCLGTHRGRMWRTCHFITEVVKPFPSVRCTFRSTQEPRGCMTLLGLSFALFTCYSRVQILPTHVKTCTLESLQLRKPTWVKHPPERGPPNVDKEMQ